MGSGSISTNAALTIGELNTVLVQYGVAALNDEEWAPLPA